MSLHCIFKAQYKCQVIIIIRQPVFHDVLFGNIQGARYEVSEVQRSHYEVSEEVLYCLAQFFAIVLFECNESEDYEPAKTLMNMCFNFYRQGSFNRK